MEKGVWPIKHVLICIIVLWLLVFYRIDIDKELEKIDDDDDVDKKTRTIVGNKEVTNLPDTIDTKGKVKYIVW